jgi:hypothetical protein
MNKIKGLQAQAKQITETLVAAIFVVALELNTPALAPSTRYYAPSWHSQWPQYHVSPRSICNLHRSWQRDSEELHTHTLALLTR